MSKQLYLAILFTLFIQFGTFAQETTPAPTPTVSPSPTPTVSPSPPATPIVNDAQNTQPENISGVPSIAPNYQSNDRELPELGRVGVDMMSQKPLTLRESIALALENNKDIEVTRKNVRIAEFDLQAARGVYEPRFTGQTYYERAKTPVFSFFGGGPDGSLTQTNFAGDLGLEKRFRNTGGRLTFQQTTGQNNTNNLFSLVNPVFTTSFGVTLTQPLFRGRSFDQDRRTIEIAKRNLSLTDTQFRQRTIETIATVQRAYWDLTYALRNLQVQRDSVKDAKQQLEHNKRLVKEGQLAEIDIVAAETQVANFEQSVYDALNTVTQSENTLKNLIAKDKNDGLWNASVVPVDPVDLSAPNTTLPEALDVALQNRPELEINQTQKDINALDQRFYREQNKPKIDLIASYSITGAAGRLNPDVSNPLAALNSTGNFNTIIDRVNTISATTNPTLTPLPLLPVTNNNQSLPDDLIGGAGQAFANLLTNRYPTYRVGISVDLPVFGNKTAKAQLGRSLVEGERLQTQREQIEQQVQVDVRNALQVLRTAEARLRSAAISRENSEKQYASEQRKLDAGQSDIYKVLERQTALTTARSNELRAQTELNKAIADLQRATGNSLKENNVEARLRK